MNCGTILFASIVRSSDPEIDGSEISGYRITHDDDGIFFANRKWMNSEEGRLGPFNSREDAINSVPIVMKK